MARSKKQERNPAFDHYANQDGVCAKCGLEMVNLGNSQCVIEGVEETTEEESDAA